MEMFHKAVEGGGFGDDEFGWQWGINELVMDADETAQGHAGGGNVVHGQVVFLDGFTLQTFLVKFFHVVFGVGDDGAEVVQVGALYGCGIADGLALDVKPVFEPVEIARLTARRAFGWNGVFRHNLTPFCE